MAQKNNIRSIRFSDEMAEPIDRQVGDTFTQKFENLITRCMWELPQKEAELQRIQKLISQKRQKLAELQETEQQIHQLKKYIDQAESYLKIMTMQTIAIADTTKKEKP